MTYTHPKISIRLAPELGQNCIYFSFKDKFTLDASENATRYWSGLFDANVDVAYRFVWDCSQMTGFEPSARKEWYTAMKKHKNRISHITIISPSLLIRGAARVMMEAFGIKSKMLKTKEGLHQLV
ncbi:hypothetical protein N7E81_16810 [Reichenbachiella carrageenanivorans]|uniref:Uncharacterized protein n=1 Tax=Reichenbachiella carrageenanivorans TaxID=2979869 RepID=A0ABY6CYM5_9BACT|nr:hypothetical protein [Reichenbachiella carrageenanivorans]UXX79017.1 hypothetical protein N7E81_16810 [Reichenbachiella carrageenanivorans]